MGQGTEPIRVERRGVNRLFGVSHQQFQAAILHAGHEARKTIWETPVDLRDFICGCISDQLKVPITVEVVGRSITTKKPMLMIALNEGVFEHLQIDEHVDVVGTVNLQRVASAKGPAR